MITRASYKWSSEGTQVTIRLDRLHRNIRTLLEADSRPPDVIFVVKSNAYGHGLVPVVKTAAAAGIRWFAVAYLDEALEVRKALPDVDILIMGVVPGNRSAEAAAAGLTPVVSSLDHAYALSEGLDKGQSLQVHIKVDSGMGRLGIQAEDVDDALLTIDIMPGLHVTGLCSHFATVEPHRKNQALRQIERFTRIDAFKRDDLMKHIASSRASLLHPEWDFNAVRVGILFYGYGASSDDLRIQTEPILEWRARVVQVKQVPADFAVGYYSSYRTAAPTQIATLSAGYADGYPRLLSNKGFVIIQGRKCRVVGRVSMNWITVDIGPDLPVQPGEWATLIGRDGDEQVHAGEIAKTCSTIPYEVLTGIPLSTVRIYVPVSG